MTRIAMVCLGNICRSPMADVVLSHRLAQAGLTEFTVTSAGTGDWHVGEPMDTRAAQTLASAGYDPSRHRAQNFDSTWFAANELILTVDLANRTDVLSLAQSEADRAKVRPYRAFDPLAESPDAEVPDPWYGELDGYVLVLDIVERTTDELIRFLQR